MPLREVDPGVVQVQCVVVVEEMATFSGVRPWEISVGLFPSRLPEEQVVGAPPEDLVALRPRGMRMMETPHCRHSR